MISAGFPMELCNEAWLVGCYLFNRTPRDITVGGHPSRRSTAGSATMAVLQKLLELQDKPDLTNLYAFGCRAYPMDTEAPGSADRVSSRAQPKTPTSNSFPSSSFGTISRQTAGELVPEPRPVRRLLIGPGLNLTSKLTILYDNLQTICLVNSDLPHLRTALRHVGIHQR